MKQQACKSTLHEDDHNRAKGGVGKSGVWERLAKTHPLGFETIGPYYIYISAEVIFMTMRLC